MKRIKETLISISSKEEFKDSKFIKYLLDLEEEDFGVGEKEKYLVNKIDEIISLYNPVEDSNDGKD
jgi:hypothetical protein